ncbi:MULTISPECIES: CIA30 family protein [Aliivibrio]|uniref:Exonuclease n=1 Tax=Aliivibrio logei TaxID=688 RepID=A0A1B9NZT3_ALILO|nr:MULTISPECIES: CIA30 family protein [Aliivibrio]MBB1314344.1 CIA30 family protein [Aliivibrio sp. SR45-2]OCH21620.1 exonuclease [Aliivibrio logei]
MIDFTKPTEYQKWLVVNDNVMSGISIGRFTYAGESSQFQGELSRVNNGGFSSIKRSLEPLPKEVNTVELVVVGDGRSYQLRLTMWKDGSPIHYKHEFSTIKGKPQKKVFNLQDFQAVFRGRLLSEAPELAADEIKQVGFLIADKQTQPFTLNLVQIQFTT